MKTVATEVGWQVMESHCENHDSTEITSISVK